MNDKKLLQQVLDALKKHDDKWLECGERVWFEEEIKAIEERLAQPEPEPVAWLCWEDKENNLLADTVLSDKACTECFPVYTAPPKKEWVGLTDEDIENATDNVGGYKDFARAIEANLKEKNT